MTPEALQDTVDDRPSAGARQDGHGRHSKDHAERLRHADQLRGVAATVLALCGALSVIYFIFAAVGAVDLEDAAVASGVAVLLGLLWLGGAWQRSRTGGGLVTRAERERRGF